MHLDHDSDGPHGEGHDHAPRDATPPASEASLEHGTSLGDTLSWAFELDQSPALAGAAWLTREIVADAKSPFDAILASTTTVGQLEELKSAYKMLRTNAASASERSLAARLYAATIAAALVRHGTLITRQRDDSLRRAFEELESDATLPDRIRELGSLARDIR
jgi:hypothetical protein